MVSTIHGVKGLEFKNMIVTGFSNERFPYEPSDFSKWSEEKKQSFILSEHLLYYVAFSRAIASLIITGVGEKVEDLV